MRIVYILLSLLTFSCIKETENAPAGLIPKDSMSLILIDIHLEESKIAVRNLQPDTTMMLYELRKREVYDKHKVTPERFRSSFEFYAKNIQELDKIYEVVVDSLSLRESRGKLD